MLNDIKDTLELLANDPSASDTEREHARRLLSRICSLDHSSYAECDHHDVKTRKIILTGDECEQEQKAIRVARGIVGMPVVLYRDDNGYSLVGDESSVSAMASIIDEIQSSEDSSWSVRMRVAWMSRWMTAVSSGHESMDAGTESIMSDIRRSMESMSMSTDPLHIRENADWKRHASRADRLANLLSDKIVI